jgi:hypothetical protein
VKTFYLGISKPHWIGEKSPLPADIPVCLSLAPGGRRLAARKTFPRATRPWLLDSGAFSKLSEDREDGGPARWDITPQQFVRDVRRVCAEIGSPDAIGPMDWMCEPPMLARTGLTVEEHQRRSVISYLELMWIDDTLPWMPPLQGRADLGPDDHLRCADMYEQYGIDLTKVSLVGVGSVCRLGATRQIVDLFAALHVAFDGRVPLHGFGMKASGLMTVAPGVRSADSQAGSRNGRHAGPCLHGLNHISEANCPTFMAEWYADVLAAAKRTTPEQWRLTVEAYAARDVQQVLFAPSIPLAPQIPTFGQALARAARVFLPDNGDPERTDLAEALDAFRAALSAPGSAGETTVSDLTAAASPATGDSNARRGSFNLREAA